MEMSNIIKERRIAMGYTQEELAAKLGLQKSAVAKYENGRVENIKRSIILKMSDILECSPSYLMGWSEYGKSSDIVINVFNRISSDFQVHATENIVDTTEISAEMAKSGEFFALKINDDSMAPDICKDDIVIVRQQNHADDGDIVITITDYDKEATCRRLSAYARGIALISNNHNYKPMTFSDDEIKSDDNPMKIIGKAVELRRKLWNFTFLIINYKGGF